MPGKAERVQARCAACGSGIEQKLLARIADRSASEYSRRLASQKKEYQTRIKKLKAEHRKALAKASVSTRKRVDSVRLQAERKAAQDRRVFQQEYSRLKAAYQASLTRLKDSFEKQSLNTVAEVGESLKGHIERGQNNHDELKKFIQLELSVQKNWLRQELADIMQSVAASNMEAQQSHTLTEEAQAREALLAKAQSRIDTLEDQVRTKNSRSIWGRMKLSGKAEPYKDEPAIDPQDDVLAMIKEIAQERNQMEKARKTEGFPDSFGSAMTDSQ